jgi:hypothetical protein
MLPEYVRQANPRLPINHQLTTNEPDVGNAPTIFVLKTRLGTSDATASSGDVSFNSTFSVSMS